MKFIYTSFVVLILISMGACELFEDKDSSCFDLRIERKWHLEAYFHYDLNSTKKKVVLYANERSNSIPDYYYPPSILKGELVFKNNTFTHFQQLIIKRDSATIDTIKVNDRGTYTLELQEGLRALPYHEGKIILKNKALENKNFLLVKRCDNETSPLILRQRIGRDSFSFHYTSM